MFYTYKIPIKMLSNYAFLLEITFFISMDYNNSSNDADIDLTYYFISL